MKALSCLPDLPRNPLAYLCPSQVDSLTKNSLYMRQQNLEKIMYEYDKMRTLNREKTDLQMQRKMSNMKASLQRQTVQAVSAADHCA